MYELINNIFGLLECKKYIGINNYDDYEYWCGVLITLNRNQINKQLQEILKIEIVESKKARSLGWNAYYWKIVVPNGVKAARGNGWEFSTDEMHEQFKKAFIIKHSIFDTASIQVPINSTQLEKSLRIHMNKYRGYGI